MEVLVDLEVEPGIRLVAVVVAGAGAYEVVGGGVPET